VVFLFSNSLNWLAFVFPRLSCFKIQKQEKKRNNKGWPWPGHGARNGVATPSCATHITAQATLDSLCSLAIACRHVK
jgi:TctA family transporter